MKFISFLIAIICTSSWAYAQSSSFGGISAQRKFTGLSVGVTGDMSSTTTKLEYQGFKFDGIGRQNFSGAVQADYGISLGSNGVLIIGAKRYLRQQNLFEVSGSGNTIKINKNNHYSVFLAPGILINDKTLAFAKLSYDRFDASLDLNGTNSSTSSVQGLGLGVGARTYVANNLIINMEVSKIMYSKESLLIDTSTGSTYGSIGILHIFE